MSDRLLRIHSGLWFANRLSGRGNHALPSGFQSLDLNLDGGWPATGVVELAVPQFGIGELRLILPVLAASLADSAMSVFAAPPAEINPIALKQAGIPLEKVVILQTGLKETLWGIEQSLKSGCCRIALLWSQGLSVTQAKRLQLAANDNNCLLFVLTTASESQALPISCRLAATATSTGLDIEVRKRRGWPVLPFTVSLRPPWYDNPAAIDRSHVGHTTNNVVPIFP